MSSSGYSSTSRVLGPTLGTILRKEAYRYKHPTMLLRENKSRNNPDHLEIANSPIG